MESTWITKTLYKNALKAGRVFMSTAMQTRNGITGYNLYIQDAKDKSMRMVCGHSPYWSDKKRCYWVTCWGTSRPLEVILSVGNSLGLKHGDIRQNWNYM